MTTRAFNAAESKGRWNAALLMARICLAAVFLYSGSTKLLGWDGTVEEVSSLGLPFVTVTTAMVIAVQLCGGLAVLLGCKTRSAALLLAGFTVAATTIGHPFWASSDAEFHHQLTIALEHLAIVGGFILLACVGPGALSMEKEE